MGLALGKPLVSLSIRLDRLIALKRRPLLRLVLEISKLWRRRMAGIRVPALLMIKRPESRRHAG